MKKEPSVKQQIQDALARVEAVATRTCAKRDTLRGALKTLETDHVKRRTTPLARDEERQQHFAEARQSRTEAEQALALANAMQHRRAAVTGKDAILKAASLLAPIEIEFKGDTYVSDFDKLQLAETRLLREELMRMRLRADLLDESPEELAATIAAAAATNNHAMLELARRVVRTRIKAESLDAMIKPQNALTNALQAIALPPAAQELDQLFDRIDKNAKQIAEALHEIDTGRPPEVSRTFLDRIAEVGGQAAAEERIAERKALEIQAEAGARKVVERAIRADEAAAATFEIPVNPNPDAA